MIQKETSKTRILIIGAGPNQLPAIKMAKSRGYNVIATDMNPDAVGFGFADDYGVASTRNVEETLSIARKCHEKCSLDGVMTMASESAVTVARVAEALGLPGLSPQAAENATNKVIRQRLFKQENVPAPDFAIAQNTSEACKMAEQLGWPVVVKPADSAGSRGVQKVETPEGMAMAIEEIMNISSVPEILIEEFLSGTEHSIEGIVVHGKIYWAGLSDRNYDKKEAYLPYFMEDGDTLPSILDVQTIKEIEASASKAVHALGINWGPVKGDILVDHRKGVKILEMAARLSGDYFCYETIPLHNGINLLKSVMDLSLGLPLRSQSLLPSKCDGVALRYIWPKPGKVVSISGIQEASSLKGIHFVNFEPQWHDLKAGSVIPSPKSMGERVASVMASAASREVAVNLAKKAVEMIRIKTDSS